MMSWIKRILVFSCMVCLLLSTMVNFGQSSVYVNAAPTFAKGADIGWLNQLENRGVTWQNDNGVKQDALEILKSKGIDSVRLRVFVNPPSSFEWTDPANGKTSLLGYGDKTGVLWMAKRAKNLGMRVMIDFHYSDHWADPGKQDKPAAWSSYSFNQLKTAVYDHTYDIMSSLVNQGVYPEWVQIGNENNSGMLWPDGSSSNFSNWAQLINQGYNAVKAASSSSKVIVHLANGANNSLFRYNFDGLKAAGAKYDVIGLSYYPYWDGVDYTQNIDALGYNLNDMASRYGKEVMITEIGGLENDPTTTYNLVRAAINKVKAVPNGKGIGVFYWEPEAHSSVLPDGYKLGATSVVSPNVLRISAAINAFGSFPDTTGTYTLTNRHSSKAMNVTSGSTADGAFIEQWGYGGWDSQKWRFVDVGGNQFRIENFKSGKALTVVGGSVSDGAKIEQRTYNGVSSQKWQLIDSGDGYYQIKNAGSGKLLDVPGRSTQDGAQLNQWTSNGGWNQMWIILKVN
jgi:arabinogalactan endo-1,4-beta-galactosidase